MKLFKKDEYGDVTFNTGVLILYTLILAIGLLIFFGAFGTIDEGERGVHLRLGKVVGTKDSGLYFKTPIIESVVKYNVKTQTVVYERENPLSSASKDLQDVQVATVVNYSLDPNGVTQIYSQFGDEETFSENVIRPAVRDVVKAMASQFTAEELVTKRPEFTNQVEKALRERLESKFVVIGSANITNFQFSPSFSASIEKKVTAEQDALAAKNKLEQVKFEAQQTVESAKANAEAIRISANAINSQGGEDYVALKAVEKWNGILPTQMIPNSSVPFLNLK